MRDIRMDNWQKLLALLLLSPLAFANTVDLHCVENDNDGIGYLNYLIQLDLANKSVEMMKASKWTWQSVPYYKVRIDKIKKDIEVETKRYKWMGENGTNWYAGSVFTYETEIILDRESLELKILKNDYVRYRSTKLVPCEIIENISEKVSYYEKELNKYNEILKKIEEEELNKNKI